MKSFSFFCAISCFFIACSCSPFGEVTEKKHYDGLSGDVTEGFASIQASVDPGQSKGHAILVKQRGRKVDVLWPSQLPAVSKLDATKVYTLDLIVKDWKKAKHKDAQVYRMRDGERVIADLSLCAMHQQPMVREVEDWIDRFDEDVVKRYPHSGIFHAVCGSGMRHVMWVCPSCQAAERKEILRASR
jgi:hypothetical protein